MRHRLLRRGLSVSLMAGAVLMLAGCGDDGGGTSKVASAGGPSSHATSGKESELAAYVKGVRSYVECLRKHDIDVPDPDGHGRIDYSKIGDKKNLKGDPTYLKAMEACSSLNPPVPDWLEEEDNPLSAKEIERNRRYAQCMQQNGAPDFPDTDEKGHTANVPWDSTSAGAKHAQRFCMKKIDGIDMATLPPAQG